MDLFRSTPRKAQSFFFSGDIDLLKSLYPFAEFNQNDDILIVSSTGDPVLDEDINSEIKRMGGLAVI